RCLAIGVGVSVNGAEDAFSKLSQEQRSSDRVLAQPWKPLHAAVAARPGRAGTPFLREGENGVRQSTRQISGPDPILDTLRPLARVCVEGPLESLFEPPEPVAIRGKGEPVCALNACGNSCAVPLRFESTEAPRGRRTIVPEPNVSPILVED